MQAKRKTQISINRLLHIILYRLTFFSTFLFLRPEIRGKENMPQEGACILASNHVSVLDPPLVGVIRWREVFSFARSTLMPNKFWKKFFELLNCIPVDRDNPSVGTLRSAIHCLRLGKALLLFPEGTRSETGELQKGKMGVGFIAHKTKAPIIPIYIHGSYQTLPKGAKFPRFKKIIIQTGPALDLKDLYGSKGNEQVYQNISNRVMKAIQDLKAITEAV